MNAQQDEIDLREYLRSGSREALGSIARRHLDFVYGVARRETGNEHQAEDVTQAVFIVLARRATKIKPSSLPGWLFVTTRNVAANARKASGRRQFHERKAAEMKSEHVMNSTHEQDQIAHIGHHLHEALAAVRESDRSIVIMRHVHGLEITEISGALGLSDDATRKRLERAMEKLRSFLSGRGFAIGSTAIATAVASVARAAPNELAGAVRTATTSSAAAMLAKATTTSMAFAQVKVAAMLLIALGIAGGITTAVWRALNRTATVVAATTVLGAVEEPPQPPAPLVVHSGVVVDPNGKPLSDVRVWSMLDAADPARAKASEAETVTDSQGRYALPAIPAISALPSRGRYDYVQRTILFDHPSYALAWREDRSNDPVNDASETVQLEPPGELRVKVIDAASQAPLAGAILHLRLQQLYRLGAGHGSRYSYLAFPINSDVAKTGEDGIVTFKRLPPTARADVRVTRLNYTVFPDSGSSFGDDTYPARPSNLPYVVALKPGGQIRLRSAQSDHPIPRAAEVLAVPKTNYPSPMISNWMTREPDGSFILSGLEPGTYDLVMNPFGPDVPLDGAWLRLRNVQVAPRQTTDASITFGPGQLITGRLVDSRTKAPLAGYSISARQLANNELVTGVTADSSADGRFALHVLSGEYRLSFEGLTAPSDTTVTVGSDAVTLGDVEIGSYPTFRGRLVDATGKPIAGGYVIAGERRYPTGQDGSFSIDSRTSRVQVMNGIGSNHVIVGTPLFAFNTEHVLGTVALANEKMADPALGAAPASNWPAITLRVLASVSGEVVDETGKPISDAELTITMLNTEWGAQFISASDPFGADRLQWGTIQRDGGKFRFDAPSGLSLRVHFNIGQASVTAEATNLTPGELRELGPMVMQHHNNLPTTRPNDLSAFIAGKILDDVTGQPLGNASVRADPDDQSLSAVAIDTTGHDGTFRLAELPPNQKVLITIQRGGYLAQSLHAETDGKDVTFRLHPAVVDLIGQPAPELAVNTWVNGGPMTLADLKGKVVLLDIGVEDWSIFAHTHHVVLAAADKYVARGLVVVEIARWLSDPGGRGRGRGAPPNRVATVSQSLIINIKAQHIPLPIAIDSFGRLPIEQLRPNVGILGQTALQYKVDHAPALILIDKQGTVRASPDRDHLSEWIEKLLAE